MTQTKTIYGQCEACGLDIIDNPTHPECETQETDMKTYRVLVRMSEYRNVWVEAPDEAEAKRRVVEEDWLDGDMFPVENQTLDSEFGEVISIEETVWSQPKLEEALGVMRITVPNVTP